MVGGSGNWANVQILNFYLMASTNIIDAFPYSHSVSAMSITGIYVAVDYPGSQATFRINLLIG